MFVLLEENAVKRLSAPEGLQQTLPRSVREATLDACRGTSGAGSPLQYQQVRNVWLLLSHLPPNT